VKFAITPRRHAARVVAAGELDSRAIADSLATDLRDAEHVPARRGELAAEMAETERIRQRNIADCAAWNASRRGRR